MPRSGGVYTLPAGNPVVTLTVISSTWANTTMADIAAALTGSVPTDGTAPMTGPLRLSDGLVGIPALAFASETSSGLYRISAGSYGFSVQGVLALSVNANRGWTIPTPAAGAALAITGQLAVTGIANVDTILATGSSTSGQSFGLEIAAGTTVVDYALLVRNQAATVTFLKIFGDGSGTLGPSNILGLSWQAAGAVTVAAPGGAAGAQNALTVTGRAASSTTVASLVVTGPNTAGNSFGLAVFAGTNASDRAINAVNASSTQTLFSLFGDGHFVLGVGLAGSAGGAFTIAAPTTTTFDALTVTGASSGNALVLVSGLAVGNACLRINGAATTGATTPSFAAPTNKPGAGTTVTRWLPIGLDGVQYWIPCWAN